MSSCGKCANFGSYLLLVPVGTASSVAAVAGTGRAAFPFFRFQPIDTQNDVPSGFLVNPASGRSFETAELTGKPIPRVAVKVKHRKAVHEAGTGVDGFNVGPGSLF